MKPSQWPTVTLLSLAQSLSWASTYYLPAVLGDKIAAETGLSRVTFYAIVTSGLLVSALMGPWVGSLVDRWGGRPVLALSTLPCTGGLTLLALAEDGGGVLLGWTVMAVGMGLGLYEAAAATLADRFGSDARRAITIFTMAAGGASSLGWIAGSWSLESYGWRLTCLNWATIQLTLVGPLYLCLPRLGRPRRRASPKAFSGNRPSLGMMALAFGLSAIVVSGMAAHLPHLIELAGADRGQAVMLAAFVGPAQMASRGAEVLVLHRITPVRLASAGALLHVSGAILVIAGTPFCAVLLPILHGSAAAILTTARATVPLVLFGPDGFGRRFGLLSMSIRLISSAGPLVFALLIQSLGIYAMALSGGLCLATAILLWRLNADRSAVPRARPVLGH